MQAQGTVPEEPRDEAVRCLAERLKALRPAGASPNGEATVAVPSESAGEATRDQPPPPTASVRATVRRRSTTSSPPPGKPGELGRLGPYQVLKVLGAGGMGVVFQRTTPTWSGWWR